MMAERLHIICKFNESVKMLKG